MIQHNNKHIRKHTTTTTTTNHYNNTHTTNNDDNNNNHNNNTNDKQCYESCQRAACRPRRDQPSVPNMI